MLDTTKAMINSVNRFKYLRNIDRVELVRELPLETNNLVTESGSKEKIEELQDDIRVNNLHVFCSSYFSLRLYRFFVVSLPAFITAASIFLFTTPTRVEKKDTADHYVKQESIYSSVYGFASSTSDVYDLNAAGDFFFHQLADPEIGTVENSATNGISVKIHDGEKCVTGNIRISSNGDMSVTSVGFVDNYIDLDEFKGINFEEAEDEEYTKLFDRLVVLIQNSGNLTKDQKATLDELTASDKKEIILKLVNYEYIGAEEVLLSKTRMPRRVIVAIIAAIYDIILIASYKSRKEEIDADILDFEDGILSCTSSEDSGHLFYSSLKMKEAFLAAERERILRLSDEIDKNVAPRDRKKLLTGYERKLVNKIRNKK